MILLRTLGRKRAQPRKWSLPVLEVSVPEPVPGKVSSHSQISSQEAQDGSSSTSQALNPTKVTFTRFSWGPSPRCFRPKQPGAESKAPGEARSSCLQSKAKQPPPSFLATSASSSPPSLSCSAAQTTGQALSQDCIGV